MQVDPLFFPPFDPPLQLSPQYFFLFSDTSLGSGVMTRSVAPSPGLNPSSCPISVAFAPAHAHRIFLFFFRIPKLHSILMKVPPSHRLPCCAPPLPGWHGPQCAGSFVRGTGPDFCGRWGFSFRLDGQRSLIGYYSLAGWGPWQIS